MTATLAALKTILADVKFASVDPATLADDADIVDDVGVDSLELLQFMLEIEARLRIRIDFERLEFSHLRSLRTLAGFLDTMPVEPVGSP